MSFYDADKINFLSPSEREKKTLFWRDDMEGYTVCKWSSVRPGMNLAYSSDEVKAFEGDSVLKISRPGYDDPILRGNINFGALPFQTKLDKHSFEVRWLKTPVLNNFYIEIHSSRPVLREPVYYGAIAWIDGVWYATNDDVTQLQEIAIELIAPGSTRSFWNYVRLTLDFRGRKFQRLRTNSLDIDLSTQNISLKPITGWPPGRSSVHLGGQTEGVGNSIYFDDARIYLRDV